MRYPLEARKQHITGRVYTQVVIKKNGSLGEVQVIQGIGHGCDQAAIRAIKNGPAWTATKIRGMPVRYRFVLPITFNLE